MYKRQDPSLLAFEERRNDENMRILFGIAHVPSDTHMREILDPVEPRQLRPLFNDVFRQLQRGKTLPAIPSGVEESGKQAGVVGAFAVSLLALHFPVGAASLPSHALWSGQTSGADAEYRLGGTPGPRPDALAHAASRLAAASRVRAFPSRVPTSTRILWRAGRHTSL